MVPRRGTIKRFAVKIFDFKSMVSDCFPLGNKRRIQIFDEGIRETKKAVCF
jgi:hypothetical protein